MGRISLHRRALICALCASIIALSAPTPSFAETTSFETLPEENVVEIKRQADNEAGSDRADECITNETHEDDSAAGGRCNLRERAQDKKQKHLMTALMSRNMIALSTLRPL